MKSIQTRYFGPTDTKGSRYAAFDMDGHRVYVHYDHALNGDENSDEAAKTLVKKMGWFQSIAPVQMVRGSSADGRGYVYVFANDHTISVG